MSGYSPNRFAASTLHEHYTPEMDCIVPMEDCTFDSISGLPLTLGNLGVHQDEWGNLMVVKDGKWHLISVHTPGVSYIISDSPVDLYTLVDLGNPMNFQCNFVPDEVKAKRTLLEEA